MLTNENGPSHIIERARYRLGVRRDPSNPEIVYAENPDSFLATLFLCIYCLSVWIAIPFAVISFFSARTASRLALIPALSAITCLLDAALDSRGSGQ